MRPAFALSALLTVALGCGGSADAGRAPAADARPGQTAGLAGSGDHSGAAPGPTHAANYTVHVESPAEVTMGREAIAKVHVSPNPQWHMNLDFPVALSVDAPAGVDVPVPKQRKVDAERFDDDALVFALPFTAAGTGKKRFLGELEFAVCADAACSPEKVALDFEVDVGCGTDAVC